MPICRRDVRALGPMALSAAYLNAALLGLRAPGDLALRYAVLCYWHKPIRPARVVPQQRRSIPSGLCCRATCLRLAARGDVPPVATTVQALGPSCQKLQARRCLKVTDTVIPTFNRSETILRAVGSVLSQTHTDLELLVIDDGGSDATPETLARIADPRVRLLSHDPHNRGAAAARNTGIQAARGAFCGVLHSDDQWLPRKLELQLAALKDAPSDKAVSCHGVHMHLLDHGIERDQPLGSSADWKVRRTLGCDLRARPTLLARREAFARVGLLDEALPRFEDWDWRPRYACAEVAYRRCASVWRMCGTGAGIWATSTICW